MSFNFGLAMKAPFSSSKKVSNILLGGIYFIIPIVGFITFGYWAECLAKAVKNPSENAPNISDFQVGSLFVEGFKFFVACIIPSLIVSVINLALAAILPKESAASFSISMILSILLMVLGPAMLVNYGRTKKVLAMINVPELFKIATKDIAKYITFIVYVIAISFIYGVLIALATFTVVGIILLPFIFLISSISVYNLVGQYSVLTQK